MATNLELREIDIIENKNITPVQNTYKDQGNELRIDEINLDDSFISMSSIPSLNLESERERKREWEFYLYTEDDETEIVAAENTNETELEIMFLPELTTQVVNRAQLKRLNNSYWKPSMGKKREEINEFIITLINSGDIQLIKKAYNQFQILDTIIPSPFIMDKKKIPDHDSLLHICARYGDGETMKKLLESKSRLFSLNVRTPKSDNGDTILHAAVRKGNVEAVNTIIKYSKTENKGALGTIKEKPRNIRRESLKKRFFKEISRSELIIPEKNDLLNKLNSKNEASIQICIQKCNHELLEIFLNNSADLTNRDKYGHNVLHEAAIQNDVTASNMIIQHQKGKGKYGEIELKNLLITKDVKGVYPAGSTGSLEIINIFLNCFGDEIDRKEQLGILLSSATERNNLDLATTLVLEGAMLDTENDQGMTPLNLASLRGYRDLALYILKEGSDPNYNSYPRSKLAINNAATSGHLDLVKVLIDYNASIWDESRMEESALHSAVIGGHTHIVRFLIKKYNINPNTRDIHGKTPLYYAVKRGYRDCVTELLNSKADPELPVDEGRKAVHIAAEKNNKNILKILLGYGAKSDEKDRKGKAPIDIAFEKDYPHIVQLLLEYRVSLERDNYELNSPMHTIAVFNSYKCADYLLRDANINIAYEQLSLRNVDKETPIDIAKRKGSFRVLFTYIEKAHNDYFERNPNIYHELLATGQFDILKVIFDRKCEENDSNTEVRCTPIMLDINEEGNSPFDENFSHLLPSLLHKLIDCEDKELREHPIVKKTVEIKLNFYRIWYTLTLFLYCIFVIILSLAFYYASYECDSQLRGTKNPTTSRNSQHIFLDVVAFVFVIVLTFSELVEFSNGWSRIFKSQRLKLVQSEIQSNSRLKKTEKDISKEKFNHFQVFGLRKKTLKLLSFLDSILAYFPRATIQYLKNSILDVIGIAAFFLHYLIRFGNPHISWIFASIAYISFILSLLKYTRIISSLGAYIDTVITAFSKDVPRFLVLYVIVLAAFIGGAHLAARIESLSRNRMQGDENTCGNVTDNFFYFNEEMSKTYNLIRPLVTGIILILDGGPGNREDDIFSIDFYFVLVYLTFSFAITVVLSNILIAQLSETYAELSAQGTFYYQMGLIVTMELESSIAFFFGKYFREYTSIKTFQVPIDEWNTLLNETPEKKASKCQNFLKVVANDTLLAVSEGNEKALTIMEYLAPLGEKIENMRKNIDAIQNPEYPSSMVDVLDSEQPKQKEILIKNVIEKKVDRLESNLVKLGAQNAEIELKLNKILDILNN